MIQNEYKIPYGCYYFHSKVFFSEKVDLRLFHLYLKICNYTIKMNSNLYRHVTPGTRVKYPCTLIVSVFFLFFVSCWRVIYFSGIRK